MGKGGPENDTVQSACSEPGQARQSSMNCSLLSPGANRALGLLYYRDFQKNGEHAAEAERHLARYLRAAPDAPDAGHVRHYLERLQSQEAAAR